MTKANIETFNVNSEEYFKYRPRYPDVLYRHIFEQCNGFDAAWDCGCGNGQVAIALSAQFTRVEASDISPNQIASSFRHEAIRYSVQRAEETEFPDRYFDLICTAQCLHWFDLDRFFPEARRVLKPGGVFACWGYGFLTVNEAVDEILQDRLYAPVDKHWAPGNRIVQNVYRDVKFPFSPISIPQVEMVVEWDADQLVNYFTTWSAVKLYNAENRADIAGTLRQHLREIISGTVNVTFDFGAYVGRL